MPGTFRSLHINGFGMISKKHQPGKWRLITDLSYPEGKSVNDAIDKSLCSLTYVSVHDVANTAVALGKGSQIAKIDIKSAYRLVPRQDLAWDAMERPGLCEWHATIWAPIGPQNI